MRAVLAMYDRLNTVSTADLRRSRLDRFRQVIELVRQNDLLAAAYASRAPLSPKRGNWFASTRGAKPRGSLTASNCGVRDAGVRWWSRDCLF